MRKFAFIFFFIVLNIFANAQNGLENIIVEKYYISNSADSIGSVGVLPSGSVTYRIYVDMLPGYKFQAAYGVPTPLHNLVFTTSTSFFNNEDRGATTPTYTKTQAKGNSVMLDSWLSVGAACSGNFGILKSEDNVSAGGANVVNNTVPPILQNADPLAGIPLTTQDGLYAGSPQSVTFVGLSSADLALFDATSNVGGSFTSSNGSWSSLNGATGPIASTNRVLIAQMTTNGIFHYELNIQIGTPTGGVEQYVAQNPSGSEISIPSLMGTFGNSSNVLPTVNISSPSNNATFTTGAVIPITANASDADGTIASVEFFVDGISIGTDNISPYTFNYTGVAGTHSLTAKATDNVGGQTTSSPISITVSNVSNPPPTVNITAPANGSSFITGAVISITANATDNGSVTSVEFFVDGVSIGVDNTSPYSVNYTGTSGSHGLTALATDNQGAQTTSSAINITVGNNIPPSITITAPATGALYTSPAVVNITADATDADGTVSLVEFYINGVLIGSDATAPYSFNWTSVIGQANITARATDNNGAHSTSSSVLISIADPSIPYKIVTIKDVCLPSVFCIPVNAIDSVHNVIGYDIVLNYNKIKVHPTGVVTLGNTLITPSYVDAINSIDSINGTMSISLFFNSSAPANARFNGIGNLFCVEFSKTSNFASIDSSSFSISFLQESYFPGVGIKNVDPGKYITYKDTTFQGNLKFWSGNSPLAYNSSTQSQYLVTNIFGNNSSCTNKSAVAVQPDLNGIFSYTITNGLDLNIERDISGSTSVQPVINGADALLIRKVLIQDPSFTPSIYQIIAMDVNEDGIISAGDVSQLNQRVVLMIPEFKQAWNYNASGVSNGQLSKDWLFIDSSTVANSPAYHISSTYPANDGVGFSKAHVPVVPFCIPVPVTNFSTCPQIGTESYKGILIGDINGNFATVGSGGVFKLNSNDKIIFDISNALIANGFVDIPVNIYADHSITALDFALKYDETNLKFESVIDPSNNLQMLSNFNEEDRTLRFTSNSFQDYLSNSTDLILRFKISKSKISENDFISSQGYLNGEKTETGFKKSVSINDQVADWIYVYPNPASNNLNVESKEDAIVQLYDIEGRIIYTGKIFANQRMEINTSVFQSGSYVLKVNGDQNTSVKKIVIKR